MGQTWKMAWAAVMANKLRTFLTMLGIIIGVMALVVLVSIADGATTSVSDQISSMGSSYLTVSISDDKENPLKLAEFQTMFTEEENVAAAAPYSRTSVTAKSGYTSESMSVTGTTGSYFSIMNLELSQGRNIKQVDLDNNSYVIIISSDTAVEFFGHADAVGETLALDGKAFQVVGVLSSDNSSLTSGQAAVSSSDDSSSSVTLEGYIPYSTFTRISDQVLEITQFYVSSSDTSTMDPCKAAVESIMLSRFGYDEDAYSVTDQSEIMEAMESVNSTMTLMLGGIAAISLLVGGIGIMNIMLVSVTERTREIGIRKAIGAGRWSIMSQFLIEALLVSMMGCLVGIGLSWIAIQIIAKVMAASLSVTMNWNIVGIAAGFSCIIGVIFGLYPANKAAAKKPIDALRYSG